MNKTSSLVRSLASTALALLTCTSIEAVNPILPLWEHIPDGEPYVFEDPDNPGKYRVYLYGSHDSMVTEYCGRDQVVWSASVDSLNQWRCDGLIFESVKAADGSLLNAGGVPDILYAPDVTLTIDAKGEKTYWLVPNNQAWGRNSMVAKSNRPDGPFVVTNWDPENPRATVGTFGFDPAIFVDDDGRVYGYWGFERSFAAELDPQTMATVKKGTKVVEDMIPSKNADDTFRFFEASSLRKIEDKYVFIYSRWTKDGDFSLPQSNYTLAYAYSDNPLGPWTFGGTIIDARARGKNAEGKIIPTATPHGNTHGSIVEINGQWWVFYHRQTGHDEYSRQAMVAPIEVTVEKGKGGKVIISEGEYTSEGFETSGLDLFKTYPAGIACYFVPDDDVPASEPSLIYRGPYPYATHYNIDPRQTLSDLELHSTPIVNCVAGSTLGYKYFNFDTSDGMDKLQLLLEIAPRGIGGTVTILIGGPSVEQGGVEVGSFNLYPSEPQTVMTKQIVLRGISQFHGKQALYFRFSSSVKGSSLCDIYSLGFQK